MPTCRCLSLIDSIFSGEILGLETPSHPPRGESPRTVDCIAGTPWLLVSSSTELEVK